MNTKNIKQSVILPCSPKEAYESWMDSEKHGEMIQGNAKIEAKVGGTFSIWDGSITGKTLELDPKNFRIVQSWRYDYEDWPKDHFSKITIKFTSYKSGLCKILFSHNGIPEMYAEEITQGWEEYYWKPMKDYFQKK